MSFYVIFHGQLPMFHGDLSHFRCQASSCPRCRPRRSSWASPATSWTTTRARRTSAGRGMWGSDTTRNRRRAPGGTPSSPGQFENEKPGKNWRSAHFFGCPMIFQGDVFFFIAILPWLPEGTQPSSHPSIRMSNPWYLGVVDSWRFLLQTAVVGYLYHSFFVGVHLALTIANSQLTFAGKTVAKRLETLRGVYFSTVDWVDLHFIFQCFE